MWAWARACPRAPFIRDAASAGKPAPTRKCGDPCHRDGAAHKFDSFVKILVAQGTLEFRHSLQAILERAWAREGLALTDDIIANIVSKIPKDKGPAPNWL